MLRRRPMVSSNLLVVLLLALALACMPARAVAEEDIPAPEPRVVSAEALGDASSEELLDGYAAQLLQEALPAAAQDESQLVPQSAVQNLSGKELAMYQALKPLLREVADGKRTSTSFSIPAATITGKSTWTSADLGGIPIIVGDDFNQTAVDIVFAELDFDAQGVLDALAADCPYELYWVYNQKGMSVTFPGLGAATKQGQWVLKVNGDYRIEFTVVGDYATGTHTVNAARAQRVRAAVAKAQGIVSQSAGLSAYDRLAYFRDAICAEVTYNQTAARSGSDAYGDPWQLVSVFDGDPSTNVVCEGYAKAFKYLCDLANIDGVECLTVTGVMSGGTGAGQHMWNVVHMDDGKTYLVDVTNCDGGTVGAPDRLFLKGYESGSCTGTYHIRADQWHLVNYTYNSETHTNYGDAQLTLANADYVSTTTESIEGATVALNFESAAYTGQAIEPQVTVTLGDKTLVAGTDYTISYSGNVNAGTATVTVTGKGGYRGTASTTFEITSVPVEGAQVTLEKDEFTFTGRAIEPTATVALGGRTLVPGTDYTLAYANNTDATCLSNQPALVFVIAHGNYTGDLEASFTILPASMEEVTVQRIDTQLYNGGAEVTPTPAVFMGHHNLEQGVDFYPVYENNVEPGIATLTLVGQNNFTGSTTVSFTIAAEVKKITFIDVDSTNPDVSQRTPHAAHIEWLANAGISTGWMMPDGTCEYRGKEAVRRQDMAAFLYRLAGSPTFVPTAEQLNAFADVDATNPDISKRTPHYNAILWLASAGISTGWKMPDGTREFRGGNTIIRQDMAAFLRRLYNFARKVEGTGIPAGATNEFVDVYPSTAHYEAIVWLAYNGVSTGWTEGGQKKYYGERVVTRQDMAAFLHRLSDVIAKGEK